MSTPLYLTAPSRIDSLESFDWSSSSQSEDHSLTSILSLSLKIRLEDHQLPQHQKSYTYWTTWSSIETTYNHPSLQLASKIYQFTTQNIQGWILFNYDHQMVYQGGCEISKTSHALAVLKTAGAMTGQIGYGTSFLITTIALNTFGGIAMLAGLIISKGNKEFGHTCYQYGASVGGFVGFVTTIVLTCLSVSLLSSCGMLDHLKKEHPFIEYDAIALIALKNLKPILYIVDPEKEAKANFILKQLQPIEKQAQTLFLP